MTTATTSARAIPPSPSPPHPESLEIRSRRHPSRTRASRGRPAGFKPSSDRNGAVVVAVPLVGMMKVSFHEIVFMTAVRNRFMSATSPMRVLTVMRAAGMSRGTSSGIRATLRQGVFIHMPLVGTVKVPVMQIVDVTFVLYADMPAARTVSVGVLIMRFVIAHRTCLLQFPEASSALHFNAPEIFRRRTTSVKQKSPTGNLTRRP